jgi:hypothetical protein
VGSVDNLLLQVLEIKLQEVKTSRQELREENPDAFPDVAGGHPSLLYCGMQCCNGIAHCAPLCLVVCLYPCKCVVSSGVLVAGRTKGRKKKRRDDDDDDGEASSLKEVDADYMQRQNEIEAEIATLSSTLLDQKNELCTMHYALQHAEGPCMEEYRAICDDMKFQRQVWHGGAPNGGDCHKAVQPQAIRRFMEVL